MALLVRSSVLGQAHQRQDRRVPPAQRPDTPMSTVHSLFHLRKPRPGCPACEYAATHCPCRVDAPLGPDGTCPSCGHGVHGYLGCYARLDPRVAEAAAQPPLKLPESPSIEGEVQHVYSHSAGTVVEVFVGEGVYAQTRKRFPDGAQVRIVLTDEKWWMPSLRDEPLEGGGAGA